MQKLYFIILTIPLFFAVILSSDTNDTGENSCEDEEMPCDDGGCVRRDEWCDGEATCDDESDEAYCRTSWFRIDPNKCSNSHFLCSNGQCIPRVAKCDGHIDCKDGSDEKKCQDSAEDKSSEEDLLDKESEEKSTEKKYSGENSEDLSWVLTQVSPTSYSTSTHSDPISSDAKSKFPLPTERSLEWSSTTSNDYYAKKMALAKTNASKQPSPAPEIRRTSPSTETSYYLSTAKQIYRKQTSRSVDASTTFSMRTEGDYVQLPTNEKGSKKQSTSGGGSIYTPPPLSQTESYIESFPRQRGPSTQSPPGQDSYTQSPPSHIQRHSRHGTSTTQSPTRQGHPDIQSPSRQEGSYAKPISRPSGPISQPPPRQGAPYLSISSRQINTPQLPPSALSIGHSGSGHDFPGILRTYGDIYPELHHLNGDLSRNGRPKPSNSIYVPSLYRRDRRNPPAFRFAKDYATVYGEDSIPHARKAERYILGLRDSSGGWGKDTARALIALSLVNNSFDTGVHENDLMQKYLKVQLGVTLIRNDQQIFNINKLASSVNALLATCQNPKDFNGWDLVKLMESHIVNTHRERRRTTINPYIYLTLCLADGELTPHYLSDLARNLRAQRVMDEARRDMMSLAILAASCVLQQESAKNSSYYREFAMNDLRNASQHLRGRMQEDGSFGSVYSTALAAQALMSLNDSSGWDPELTFNYLRNQQQQDGSFGDLLATYYVLPPLSGRTLIHLRNTRCYPPKEDKELTPSEILQHPGPKFYVHYSLYFGDPLDNVLTMKVLVPHGINFFDVMRAAQNQNSNFRFSFEEQSNGDLHIYSLSGIPNDSERNSAWHLYIKRTSDVSHNTPNDRERSWTDVRQLFPTADQHFIFWYHPINSQRSVRNVPW